jgi:autotransporter strand-loop-strand O-heptosyltransferase
MKICQVNPGCGLEIPPKGWGAIEKIIWEFTTNLRKQGYQVDIKWANEVKKGEYDLVVVHVANLALFLAEQDIPYVFQCHDHHAFYYGKGSLVFKENLEAIQKSELSILPAKYLVDYFGSNKAIYFSHGVNTEFFVPNLEKKPHKLLMVANNGLGGGGAYDRKGFTEGIQVAKGIGLPLTIAGPENNRKFIEENPWVKSHNINWVFSPTQEELLKLYQEHTIFLHPSELEAGHPNLTLLEAMACGLPVVGCMEDDLEGMVITKKKTRSLYEGIRQVLDNYQEYQAKALHTSHKLSWFNRSKELINLVKKPIGMKEILVKEYSNTIKRFITPKPSKVEVIIDFIDGARCELKGNFSDSYKIEFIDKNNVVWQDTIQCGMWTKVNRKYFTPWKIKITNLATNELIFDYNFNCKNKKVYIYFDSKSIGDTIAWFPYVEEFRKKHGCEVICSTFHNEWFEPNYPEIKFVPPGHQPENLYASFGVGIYYNSDKTLDYNKHPTDFLQYPLQKVSSDILGLEFNEIKPKITSTLPSPIQEKYVTISTHSTAQCKYWNHPTGWEQLIKFLKLQGYKVVLVDQHTIFGTHGFMNTSPGSVDYSFIGKPFDEVLSIIKGAEFHIGLSSGLSWVAWALDIPIVLISSFTKPYLEPTLNCTRIYNESPTSGYYNSNTFDPSDWNWYPYKKINSMEDWYEIETITPEQVIEAIKTNLL